VTRQFSSQRMAYKPATLGADGKVRSQQLPATMDPTAHAESHAPGGSDALTITEGMLVADSDVAQLADEVLIRRDGVLMWVTVQSIIDLLPELP